MTIQNVVELENFTWVDMIGPDQDELIHASGRYRLPPSFLEDCLDPDHLPKYQRIGDATFLVLRLHDDAAPDDSGTIQELTRKIAIFYRPDLVLTVHRIDLHEVAGLRALYRDGEECSQRLLIVALINAALDSYEKPLERSERMLDSFESGVFGSGDPPTLRQSHDLKRRISLTRRILWQTSQAVGKLTSPEQATDPLYHDIHEALEAYLFWTDQLLEQAALLQQVQLAMASHRTNEVMRVLTVFSAFFLPLTFIVGVYGMNFAHMPELEWSFGYGVVWVVMLGVAGGVAFWFKRKGWL